MLYFGLLPLGLGLVGGLGSGEGEGVRILKSSSSGSATYLASGLDIISPAAYGSAAAGKLGKVKDSRVKLSQLEC